MNNDNKKKIIIIALIILLILLCIFIVKIKEKYKENKFASQLVELYDNNKNPVFEINKIILYSSSTAIDKSEEQTMQSVDVHQFTDIAIYINNKKSIQNIEGKNTIKEIYIDDIKIEKNNLTGNEVINYKNSYLFGKYTDIQNYNDRIELDVILKNNQNEDEKYEKPVFYTDCSNPITLGYINKNIIKDYKVTDKNVTLSLDGTILKNAKYDLNELNAKIKFNVHIKNNLDEEFITNVEIDNSLESEDGGIYTGYIINISNVSYDFLELPKQTN